MDQAALEVQKRIEERIAREGNNFSDFLSDGSLTRTVVLVFESYKRDFSVNSCHGLQIAVTDMQTRLSPL